jgi:Uma2 family endonuclease
VLVLPPEKSDNVLMLARAHVRDPLSDAALYDFGEANPGWMVERVGGSFVMTPTVSIGGAYNSTLNGVLFAWGRAHGYKSFDSQTGFTMPNGDVLVPDASLLKVATWTSLDKATQESYAPVILDVVAEIVSKTDRISKIVAKCEGYRADGHRYVLMFDPIRESVQAWGEPPADFPSPEELLAEILR